MRLEALLAAMVVAVLSAGCEPGPMKPETGAAPRATSVERPDTTRPWGDALSGERSIRLFGRGVSRDKQIRV